MVEAYSGCSCSTVVHDAADLREEPVVRGVIEHKHVLGDFEIPADSAPAFRNEGAYAGEFDCGEDSLCKSIGVVDHDGAEADVNRFRAGGEEGGEGGWGGEV